MSEGKSRLVLDSEELKYWENFVYQHYDESGRIVEEESKALKIGFNRTLLITFPTTKYIIRISNLDKPNPLTLENFQGEIEVLNHLEKAPLNVIRAIPKKDGTYVTEINNGQNQVCVVFEFIEGKLGFIIPRDRMFEIGQAYGILH